jgi:predicted  nucleic acid-binding Zn-ribbon protein
MSIWESLLEVQNHDTTIDQLVHRNRTLPERAALETVMHDIGRVDSTVVEVDARRTDLARAQKKLEDEIASLNDKAEQVDKKLYSGTVNIPKELQALQDDVEHIRARVRHLEDQELELMEQAEPVDAEREQLVKQRDAHDAEAMRLSALIAEAESAIDAELQGVRAERDAAAGAVPPELVAQYEGLRKRHDGIAVARLINGRSCGGCHLQLSAVEVDRIKGLDPDEPVNCEECGRLLVRG